ncbi:MarR family transcriptional regulator [Sphingobium sp. CCH11-B1]|jgi:DNA-binding MarR family transcriptional regulator|uniref:MarR family transcriptional regulator n=1 Tax=Sphingobium sp. CCH11-B1 TaxID=1768781 RepID=UPI00082AC689|nr:MarR family winged helix-turn-helix transcriptional regulator [Sphingobium sp. CCH11-B1]MEA3390165.1 MarR family winged helix-turn-helix transcriptional regulator [Pseudomonadota bacterium]
MNAHAAPIEIERPGIQPLGQWMRTLVDYVRSGKPDLTNRQMALMMTVYIGQGPHTVRGLAEALHVSKPVITRALNKLSALGYLRRERDAADRRNIFITRTTKGAEFLDAFHHFIAGTARDERHEHPHKDRVG